MTRKDAVYFVLRKLHSLTGLLPVGVFLVFHMYINAYVTMGDLNAGAVNFNEAGTAIADFPYFIVIELSLLAAILYHGIFGIIYTFKSGQNMIAYTFWRNWAYAFQRWSGVIAVFFIGYHAVTLRFVHKSDYLTPGGEIYRFTEMVQTHISLDNPIMLIFYLLGILSAVFHFTNGIWNFLISWGITTGRKTQRISAICCIGLFFIMIGIFTHIVIRYLSY